MNDRRLAAQSGMWSIILQWSRFGLNTVVFLILARWLSLAEIGAFAVAFAPVNLLQLVQRAGVSETVVQGPEAPGSSTDTIFWMSTGFGLVMSVCVFGFSFAIAPIMESAESETYLAAMAVIPALIGAAAVPEGLLRRRMEIRTLAIRTTASLTIAGLVAIWLGYAGYGGWALTAFAIVNAAVSSVLVMMLVRWTPAGGPRLEDARKALPVVAAISGRSLANQAAMPLLQLMVGAGLGPAAAGAFQIAQRLASLAATATLTPLRFATLPVFVRVRDDADRLRRTVVKTAGLISFVSAPIYFGLLAVAPVLVPLAVGEANGPPSVPVLQALLLVGAHVGFFPVFVLAFTAIERADVALRWSVGLFVLNMAIGAATVLWSATATALGYSLLGYVAAPFMLRALRAHTGVSAREMVEAVCRPVFAAVAMAAVILLVGETLIGRIDDLALLAVEIGLGVAIYVVMSLLVCRPQIATTRNLLVTLKPERL
ncbi:oligosaccharide flippase family protein [Pikeienuella sp. HZG-20]|uniref:oligosaccharide flippase family protein n=1 Tax=Paludibacillus litoralis TaxID=3133267 RepID=UPI0030EC84EF